MLFEEEPYICKRDYLPPFTHQVFTEGLLHAGHCGGKQKYGNEHSRGPAPQMLIVQQER